MGESTAWPIPRVARAHRPQAVEWVGAVAVVVFVAALIAVAVPQRTVRASSAGPLPTLGPALPFSGSTVLGGLLPTSPGADFLTVPPGMDQVGPIGMTQMLARLANPAAEQALLDRTGFLGGYKKAWDQRRTLHAAFAYILEFGTADGATAFAQARLLGYRLGDETDFDPGPQVPGAQGVHITLTVAGGAKQYQTRLVLVQGRRVLDIGIAAATTVDVDSQLVAWVAGYLGHTGGLSA